MGHSNNRSILNSSQKSTIFKKKPQKTKSYSTTLSGRKQAERKATLVSGGTEKAKNASINSEGGRLLEKI